MKFTVEKELFDKFPNAKIGGLFIYGLNNQQSENIARVLNDHAAKMKGEKIRLESVKYKSWEYSLAKLGINTKEIQSSHTALSKRAISGGSLPDINPLVNTYNYTSIKHYLPIGGHNIDAVANIQVGKTNGGENFKAMGSEEVTTIKPEEFAYLDRENNRVLTRNLVWRQCDEDKITDQTKNVFIPIDDIPGNFTYEQIEKIAIELASIIKTELGYEKAVFGITNRYNFEIDSDILPNISFDKTVPSIILNKRMDVVTDEEKINEVLNKGVKEVFPGKEEIKKLMMSGKRLKLYTGIDPTANFIHMGHMIWMKKLGEFQKLGHEVVFLIGGFTAMIGDPDKKYSREPLTKEMVAANFENYKKDATRVLDFDWKDNPVQIVNNYDWLSPLSLESWLGVMSNVTLQHILSHDMFKNRLESEQPIRLHEIMYPLMQGYDSVAMEVDLEVGGSDQTFNMLTGRILERNMIGKEKFVITLKLLTDNGGKKMGKTTNNAISFKDSPNDVYGKIMSFSDEVLPLGYELLSKKTLKELEEVNKIIKSDPMSMKKNLAYEMVELIHGEEEAEKANQYFQSTIQNKETPDDISEHKIEDLEYSDGEISILDIVDQTNLVDSRGEAKRLIKQGGVKLNGEKTTDFTVKIKPENGNIIQAGKLKWVKLV